MYIHPEHIETIKATICEFIEGEVDSPPNLAEGIIRSRPEKYAKTASEWLVHLRMGPDPQEGSPLLPRLVRSTATGGVEWTSRELSQVLCGDGIKYARPKSDYIVITYRDKSPHRFVVLRGKVRTKRVQPEPAPRLDRYHRRWVI